MKQIIDFVVARLGESSTWRGVILLLTIVGVKLDPSQTDAIVTAGGSLYALINVFRKG